MGKAEAVALNADARILLNQVQAGDAVRSLVTMLPHGFTITCRISTESSPRWTIIGRRSPSTVALQAEGRTLSEALSLMYAAWLEWNPTWRG